VEARAAGKPVRPAIRVTSDPQGQFLIRLPVGEYAVAVQAKDHASQTIPIVRAMGQPDPLEFRLAPVRLAPTAGHRRHQQEHQHTRNRVTSRSRRVGTATAAGCQIGSRRREAHEVRLDMVDIAHGLHVIERQTAQINLRAGEATETYIVACVMTVGRSSSLQSGTGLPRLSRGRGITLPSAKVAPGLKHVWSRPMTCPNSWVIAPWKSWVLVWNSSGWVTKSPQVKL